MKHKKENFNKYKNKNIISWNPAYFCLEYEDKVIALDILCKNKMSEVILSISDWKYHHFRSNINTLCRNKMGKILLIIGDLKTKHFLNKDEYGFTGLWYLCKNKMKNVIGHIGFKLKHCTSYMEKRYIEKIL